MCTVVISLAPDAAVPVLVLAIRDEMFGRPWRRPGYHWPRHPGLVGGFDDEAGGTWLALNPAVRRVSCVLNGEGPFPTGTSRSSRGGLPLAAASGSPLPANLAGFPPFHLVTAGVDTDATIVSWDGRRVTEAAFGRGVHVVGNSGADLGHPRVSRLALLLDGIARPDPRPGDTPQVAWASWLDLLSLRDVEPDDPRAVIRRNTAPGDLLHGSSSVSLVAMSDTEVRYDFVAIGDPPLPLGEVTSVSI